MKNITYGECSSFSVFKLDAAGATVKSRALEKTGNGRNDSNEGRIFVAGSGNCRSLFHKKRGLCSLFLGDWYTKAALSVGIHSLSACVCV